MKAIVIFASTLLVATAAQAKGEAGEVFFTKSIKKQICEYAAKEKSVDGLRVNDCSSAKFIFAADKVRVTIKGVKKPLTTLMKVEFTTNGADVNATVKAKIEVTTTGRLKRTGWDVVEVTTEGFSDKAILDNTWGYDTKYIRDAKISSLPKAMLKDIEDATHESLVEDVFNNAGESGEGISNPDDISVDELEDLKEIVNPANGNIVGYLITGSASSEQGDIRVSTTFKLDLNGNIVAYYSESFGYHE